MRPLVTYEVVVMTGCPPCMEPADSGDLKSKSRPGWAARLSSGSVLVCARPRRGPPSGGRPPPARHRADLLHGAIIAGASAPCQAEAATPWSRKVYSGVIVP